MSSEISRLQTDELSKLQGKIYLVCQAVRWMAILWSGWILVMILLPLADLSAWRDQVNKSPAFAETPVTIENLLATRCVNLFVWAVSLLIGISLWKLMTSYLNGDIFSQPAARRLRRVAQAGILTTVINAMSRPLSYWLLSPTLLHTTPATAFFVPDDLLYVMISALIFSFASVYRAAAEINAEIKQFV